MKRISVWLTQVSSGWMTLLALVVFVLFMALVLPEQSAQADENAGGSATPDLSFVYSVSDLYQMADSYGEQGRSEYVKVRFTFDLVWPLVYTFFLVTALSWLFAKSFPVESFWQGANLIPLFGLLLDYLENISTSIVMLRFPAQTMIIDALATVFTPAKWIFVSLSFVLLLIGLVIAPWRLFQKR